MKKRFVKSNHEPKMIAIQGKEYPALFSMSALAEVEDLTDTPYLLYFDKLSKNECRLRDQIALIVACLHAGGTEVTIDDLMESMDLMQDLPAVLNQVVEMVGNQIPESEKGKKRK